MYILISAFFWQKSNYLFKMLNAWFILPLIVRMNYFLDCTWELAGGGGAVVPTPLQSSTSHDIAAVSHQGTLLHAERMGWEGC